MINNYYIIIINNLNETEEFFQGHFRTSVMLLEWALNVTLTNYFKLCFKNYSDFIKLRDRSNDITFARKIN